MQDRPERKGYGDTWVLPDDELAARRTERMLIEEQPDTFVNPRAVPEDVPPAQPKT